MVEHINGEIYLALCADDVWLEMQEYTNRIIIEKQRSRHGEKTVGIEQSPLIDINQSSDGDALVRYITSIINKLFPIYRDDSSQNLALFGLGDSDEPYQYAPGFRPHTDTKQLDFDVTYLGRNQNDGRMVVKISWDFDSTDVNNEHQMYCPYLAEEILLMFSESVFLNEGFVFYKSVSYSELHREDEELQYSQVHRYELIEDGFVADRTNLENGLRVLAPLTRTDGILRTLDDAYYDTNYDGYGYLCKEIDGVIYQSSIVPNMDKPYPKIYLDNFTHIYWYERN